MKAGVAPRCRRAFASCRRCPFRSARRRSFSEAVAYVDDTTLVQSLWRVAGAERLRVRVQFLEPLASSHAVLTEDEREELMGRARNRLVSASASGGHTASNN